MSGRLLLCLAVFLQDVPAHACALSILRQAFLKAELAASGDRNYRWEHDGLTSAQSVTSSFWPFLGRDGIEGLLRDRKAGGKSTHVAEFFGSAVFVQTAEIVDSVSGIRLERHYEASGMPISYYDDHFAPLRPPLWQEIPGDIYQRATWHSVDRNMRERDIPAYDLIVVRPIGGVKSTSGELAVVVLNRIYERLSDDDGVMLVSLTVDIPQKEEWLARLREGGVQIEWHPHTAVGFRLIKSKGSPPRLPKL